MTNVLIVGSGPTGLTLAIELARRGVDFRIVESSPQPNTGVRGKGLQPRTLEVFDDLGVIDEILATGREYPSLRSYQGDQVVWEGRMDEIRGPSEGVPYPNLIMQPQWRTERILRDRLAELGHQVEFGVELAGFEQDDEGVAAHLSTGEHVRCAYLVGADGGRSIVRKRLGVGFAGETYESERMLLADIKTSDLDHEHWHVWGSMAEQAIHFTICPLPNTDVFQLVAPYTGDDDLLGLVGRHAPHVRIDEVVWRSEYRVNIRMAERFRAGRVFLAGDAAHVHTPAGGQGLNTGVQDAYNLGWKLGAVLRAGAPDALLDTYEEERRANAAAMLDVSTGVHRGEVRRGKATMQLGLGYRESSLSVEPRTDPTGVRAGDRAPDGTVSGVRLFDAFRGPHWTLLGAETSVAGVRSLPAAPESYGPGVFLIRPDGYVGWAGDSSDGLEAYLAEVGA
jgi:2-polyprenyl-6-methoxyphenol hydroxylase-like FAD-dependent oxidoreductase